MKVHGIKHALDGGVKVRLGELGVIKGNSHWRRADGSLSFGSFPGGLCWCLRQRRGRLGGPCRNRWTRNKQNRNLKAQYLPTLGLGPQQHSGPDRTVESWLSPALWAQGIASLLPGSLCKHPFPTGPHGVGLQRSAGWGFSWRQISTSCRPFSGHKSLLILIIRPPPAPALSSLNSYRNSNWQQNQGPSGCRASSGSTGREAAKCFLVVTSLQHRSSVPGPQVLFLASCSVLL